MRLSVITPTYNEADNVETLIREVSRALGDLNYEILVVDDDSPDLTWRRVAAIAQSNPQVRVLRRTSNRGLGPAVAEGFASARGEIVACMDADLQHDPAILPQMVAALDQGAEVVVASRYTTGGGVGDWNAFRRLSSWIATKMAQLLIGIALHDPMSGYFMLRRRDFLAVRDRLNVRGFKILLEIIARMTPKHVAEISYTFRPRVAGESKLSSMVIFEYLRQLWHLSSFARLLSLRS